VTQFRSYKKKKSYLLPVFLILLAVTLSFSYPRFLRPLIQNIIYPFQFVAVSLWKGTIKIPSFFLDLRNLSKENSRLRGELSILKPKLLPLDELAYENNRLRSLLNFKQNNFKHLKLLPAEVMGKSPTPWFSILEVNQGSRAGVSVNMPVVVDQGVVGRVIEVSLFSSKVMLLIDPESSVAAVDSRSRDFGVVAGSLPDKLYMKYVSAGGDILVGDLITTSQVSTIFPPGLPLGKVWQATKREHDLFYHIEIKPVVDFSRLEEVYIVI